VDDLEYIIQKLDVVTPLGIKKIKNLEFYTNPIQIKQELDKIEEAIKIAESIGYPVIVKASAGGGGIGMRTVYEEDELIRAIESTQSVAKSAFGDSTVYIEKYLEEPRHIEFQILADEHGNTIHVADRECSIQRRHQKLIEEAPSPIMTDELRERMGSAAVKAAEYIGYTIHNILGEVLKVGKLLNLYFEKFLLSVVRFNQKACYGSNYYEHDNFKHLV